LQAEGIAVRDHPLTHLQIIGVAERHRDEIRGAVDLDERDMRFLIAPDDLRLERLAGRQLDDDLVGVLDHVVVGGDEAGGVDDEARPEALRLVRHPARGTEEPLERPEELVERVVLSASSASSAAAPAPARSTGSPE